MSLIKHIPTNHGQAPEFCGPVPMAIEQSLTVNPKAAPALLNLPQYKQIDTMDLIRIASARLRFSGLVGRVAEPKDRPTAIAILEGVHKGIR